MTNVEAWAPLMWSSNYVPLLEVEQMQNAGAQETLLDIYPMSSYRRRMSNPELIARYDLREVDRMRDTLATVRRSRNMRAWSFSQLARSGSYFNQDVPANVWAEESSGRRLASRPTVKRLLQAMVLCEPLPDFHLHVEEWVAVFGVDQTYKWQGCAKGGKRHRGEQRMGANGVPITIEHLVYVNGVRLKLPYTLPCLTPGCVLYLRNHPNGVYTESTNNLFPPLYLDEFTRLS